MPELFAFDPRDFRPGGSVDRWARALLAPRAVEPESLAPSARLIACGAVSAWSSITAIADTAKRDHARTMLRDAVLRELVHSRPPGVRAAPTAVPAIRPDLTPFIGEPPRVTAMPDIRPAVSDISQLLILEMMSRMDARLDRIEAGIGDIAKVSGTIHDQLRSWTLNYETISGTPRLFTLTPVSKRGLDKAAVWHDTYQLTLWCEHDDQPHPWPPAQYQFHRPRDWLITVAPYAMGVLSVLRLAVSVSVPVTTLAGVDLGKIKDDLEAMDKLFAQLPKQVPGMLADPGPTAESVLADGPELRALRALLTELDPGRTFNGMHAVATPPGDIRWVCQSHYPMYKSQPGTGNAT